MSIAFLVLKLEGGSYRPSPGLTGSRNSPSGIGLNDIIGNDIDILGSIRKKAGVKIHLWILFDIMSVGAQKFKFEKWFQCKCKNINSVGVKNVKTFLRLGGTKDGNRKDINSMP